MRCARRSPTALVAIAVVAMVACSHAPLYLEATPPPADASAIRDESAASDAAPPWMTDVAPLLLAYEHACLLEPSGRVRCAGVKAAGQLGDGHTAKLDCPWGCEFASDAGCLGYARCWSTATSVLGLTNATSIHTDGYRTCAVHDDRTVVCWGPNGDNALHLEPDAECTPDDPDIRCAATPVSVGLANVAELAMADGQLCVRRVGGGLECAEYVEPARDRAPLFRELPPPRFASRSLVKEAVPPIVRVAVGSFVWCALDESGSVWCRGWPPAMPPAIDDASTEPRPQRVVGLDGVRIADITVGTLHACALDEEGRVWCWGSNDACVLGRENEGDAGRCTPEYNPPSPVPGIPRMVRVVSGRGGSCGIGHDGSLWCWGLYAKTPVLPGRVAEHVRWVALGSREACWIAEHTVACKAVFSLDEEVPAHIASLFVAE